MKKKLLKKPSLLSIILFVVLVTYVVIILVLLVWALITSFKAQHDFRLNVLGLPKKWVWNYSFVFEKFFVQIQTDAGSEKVYMARMFLYSLLYSLGCCFFSTLIPCITSYACATFDFKFSKVIYTVVLVVMALPIVGNLPSEIQMAKTLGLFDKIWGIWIMKAHFLGMYFLVFYNTFKSFPTAYREAAMIDGASNWKIMTSITLPLVRNTFFTVMLITFISFWNDYQTPLIYLPSYPTVALGMYHMGSTTENGLSTVPMRMTGAMLMLVPILILFSLLHKKLMGNLTMGGIKG